MASRTPIKFGDIYIARISYGHSTDQRPCIVVNPLVQNELEVLACSSQLDMFEPGLHFRIEDGHPDFKYTGLKRTSYANSDEKHILDTRDLGKFVGRLEGALLAEFRKWYG